MIAGKDSITSIYAAEPVNDALWYHNASELSANGYVITNGAYS